MNKLYLDDLRDPPVGWTLYRPDQIGQFIKDCQFADQISFDHDLGDNYPNGAQVAERIFKIAIEENWWTDKIPVFNVHSMNPVGRENIWRILDSLIKIIEGLKNPHEWVSAKPPINYEHCSKCLTVRRADSINSKVCKGPIKLRDPWS